MDTNKLIMFMVMFDMCQNTNYDNDNNVVGDTVQKPKKLPRSHKNNIVKHDKVYNHTPKTKTSFKKKM